MTVHLLYIIKHIIIHIASYFSLLNQIELVLIQIKIMKKILLASSLIVAVFSANAQSYLDQWRGESARIYEETDLDQVAYFEGGARGLQEYVKENLKYPKQVIRMGISGDVYVEAIIEKDGSVSVIAVRIGIGGGADEESLRLVKSMPKWDPATRNGTPVRQRKLLKIAFDKETVDSLRK